VHLLHQYDQVHGTRYFGTLKSADVVLNDHLLEDLLVQFSVPHVKHDTINQWYREQRWSPEAIVAGHRPVRGVLEVLRWFQIQPRTRVALITARPETVRTETLRSLNELGRQCRVQFDRDWLLMTTLPPDGSVAQAKVAAVAELRSRGMRIVALIDNEPDNLEAIAQANDAGEILLLHADTIFESKRRRAPRGVARGTSFNLTDLATEDRLRIGPVEHPESGFSQGLHIAVKPQCIFCESAVRDCCQYTIHDGSPLLEIDLHRASVGLEPYEGFSQWITGLCGNH